MDAARAGLASQPDHGASSGSINAFIAAIASCKSPGGRPCQSLFWKVWLPVGADALLSRARVYRTAWSPSAPSTKRSSGSTRPGKRTPGIRRRPARWSRPQRHRLRARYVAPLDGVNLKLPLQTEKVLFTMRGAHGSEPLLTPFGPPAQTRALACSKAVPADRRSPADRWSSWTSRRRCAPHRPFAGVSAALAATDVAENSKDQLDTQWFHGWRRFDNNPGGSGRPDATAGAWRATGEARPPPTRATSCRIRTWS